MITRHPPRPHICLRCQRSLARRSAPSRTHVAFNSTSNPDETTKPDDKVKSTLTIRKHSGDYRRDGASMSSISSGLSQYPLGKLYGHRGHKLRENREDLDLNSLGDPAKVIVLRESKLNFYDSGDTIDDQTVEHVDIISQLENERGLAGPTEVEANISAFKPKDGEGPRSWDDLNEIVRIVQESFTNRQLADYLESFQRRNPRIRRVAPSKAKQFVPILGATSWMPGVSEISDSFDAEPLRGYFMQSHTSKQQLVLRILRECWQVELPEVAEGIGQFEVEIGGGYLPLMSTGSPSPFAMLQEQYLALADETLEIYPSRGVIRVTTMRHKKEIFLDILAEELNKIRRKTVCLGDMYPGAHGQLKKGRNYTAWLEQNFPDSVLQELGRLTNTEIVRLSKQSILVSSYENSPESKTSSRIDVLKRLLLSSSSITDRAEYSLECDGIRDAPASYVPYPQVEGFNWRDSLRSWMRWTAPVPKAPEPISKQAHEVNDTIMKSLEDKPAEPTPSDQPSLTPHETLESPTWWKTQQFTESSVLFGSVLSCQSGPTPLSKPFSGPTPIQTFSTIVPNLSQALSRHAIRDASVPLDAPITYCTLRFLPNPFQPPISKPKSSKIQGHEVYQGVGAEVLKTFPPIEMRFAISHDNRLIRLKEVQAIIKETKTDVMIPSNGVDIRWQDRTTKRLRFFDRKVKGLQDFIKKSNLSLRDNKMETPPTLKLPIDKDLCQGQGLKLISKGDKDSEDVEYIFAGLDIRKTLVFNYYGWRLLYTSIEAGRAGGRRAELKLRPIHKGKVDTGKAFTKIVYDLAHDLGGDVPDRKGTKESKFSVGSPVRKVMLGRDEPLVRGVSQKWGVDEEGKKVGFWARRVNLSKGLEEGDRENETLLGDGLWEKEGGERDEEDEEICDFVSNELDAEEQQDELVGSGNEVSQKNPSKNEDSR